MSEFNILKLYETKGGPPLTKMAKSFLEYFSKKSPKDWLSVYDATRALGYTAEGEEDTYFGLCERLEKLGILETKTLLFKDNERRLSIEGSEVKGVCYTLTDEEDSPYPKDVLEKLGLTTAAHEEGTLFIGVLIRMRSEEKDLPAEGKVFDLKDGLASIDELDHSGAAKSHEPGQAAAGKSVSSKNPDDLINSEDVPTAKVDASPPVDQASFAPAPSMVEPPSSLGGGAFAAGTLWFYSDVIYMTEGKSKRAKCRLMRPLSKISLNEMGRIELSRLGEETTSAVELSEYNLKTHGLQIQSVSQEDFYKVLDEDGESGQKTFVLVKILAELSERVSEIKDALFKEGTAGISNASDLAEKILRSAAKKEDPAQEPQNLSGEVHLKTSLPFYLDDEKQNKTSSSFAALKDSGREDALTAKDDSKNRSLEDVALNDSNAWPSANSDEPSMAEERAFSENEELSSSERLDSDADTSAVQSGAFEFDVKALDNIGKSINPSRQHEDFSFPSIDAEASRDEYAQGEEPEAEKFDKSQDASSILGKDEYPYAKNLSSAGALFYKMGLTGRKPLWLVSAGAIVLLFSFLLIERGRIWRDSSRLAAELEEPSAAYRMVLRRDVEKMIEENEKLKAENDALLSERNSYVKAELEKFKSNFSDEIEKQKKAAYEKGREESLSDFSGEKEGLSVLRLRHAVVSGECEAFGLYRLGRIYPVNMPLKVMHWIVSPDSLSFVGVRGTGDWLLKYYDGKVSHIVCSLGSADVWPSAGEPMTGKDGRSLPIGEDGKPTETDELLKEETLGTTK